MSHRVGAICRNISWVSPPLPRLGQVPSTAPGRPFAGACFAPRRLRIPVHKGTSCALDRALPGCWICCPTSSASGRQEQVSWGWTVSCRCLCSHQGAQHGGSLEEILPSTRPCKGCTHGPGLPRAGCHSQSPGVGGDIGGATVLLGQPQDAGPGQQMRQGSVCTETRKEAGWSQA